MRQIIEDLSARLRVILPLALDAWSRKAWLLFIHWGDLVLVARIGGKRMRTVTIESVLQISYATEVVTSSGTDLGTKTSSIFHAVSDITVLRLFNMANILDTTEFGSNVRYFQPIQLLLGLSA